jgi:hypothetical protein
MSLPVLKGMVYKAKQSVKHTPNTQKLKNKRKETHLKLLFGDRSQTHIRFRPKATGDEKDGQGGDASRLGAEVLGRAPFVVPAVGNKHEDVKVLGASHLNYLRMHTLVSWDRCVCVC